MRHHATSRALARRGQTSGISRRRRYRCDNSREISVTQNRTNGLVAANPLNVVAAATETFHAQPYALSSYNAVYVLRMDGVPIVSVYRRP